MAEIVPAILEETKPALTDKIFQVSRLAGLNRIQIDFGDGKFVPHQTLDIKEFDLLNPVFQWEAHVMVQEPTSFLDYKIAGFQTIIIHYESFTSGVALEQTLEKVSKSGLQPAVAIKPETDPKVLPYFFPKVKQFLVLGVEPGFQGRPFIPETVNKIRALRGLLPDAIIEVDGGVAPDNAPALVESGANFLAVGSHLFEKENLQQNFTILQQAITKLE